MLSRISSQSQTLNDHHLMITSVTADTAGVHNVSLAQL